MADISEIFQLGFQCHQSGELERAEAFYSEVLKREPGNTKTLLLLSILSSQTSRLELAIQQMRDAISIEPGVAAFHLNLGILLDQSEEFQPALASFREAIRLQSGSAEAHFRMGNTLRRLGNNAEAIAHYMTAVGLTPDHAAAHNNLGVILKEEGNFTAALECYRQAITLKPDYAEAHNNLGVALRDQGDPAAAAVCYRRAIALKPDYATAHDNLGIALQDQGDLAGAEACGRRAVALQPENATAWANLGVIVGQRDVKEEQKCLEQAIALQPGFALAHWNLALSLLLQGDCPAGWREYEWRWQWKDFSSPKRDFLQPLWRGEPLEGARILLHAEQGFGDTIQMLRYVPLVAARGGKVILEVPRELRQLVAAGLPGAFDLFIQGESLPAFDCQCPLMSLPLAFGTTVETIPSSTPYLRNLARPEAVGQSSRLLRVGLAWAGSPNHKGDRHRSIPPQMLAPLGSIEGIQWISLQAGPSARATGQTAPPFAIEAGKMEDFAETAATVASLDLVLTVDTAVAHLAGAMDKPAWVMLSHRPDWRWLLEREDSPWYPTARLFRQSSAGCWTGVIERVGSELRELVKRWTLALPALP